MRALFIIATTFWLIASSTPAQAICFELGCPGIALPKNFPDASKREIEHALQRPEYKFVGGSALNWHTTLRYSGSTKTLNQFLQNLTRCKSTIIQITFVKSLPQDGDWHVHHSAFENGKLGFHVRISLASKKLKLSELLLPEIQNPVKLRQHPVHQPLTSQ